MTDDHFLIKGTTLIKYSGNQKNVIIPEGIETIYHYCFYRNNKIVSVVLPSTLKTIEYYSFGSCKHLKDINFSDTQLEEIQQGAFFSDKKLGTTIRFPKTLKRIGIDAFAFCKNINNVILPNINIEKKSSFPGCNATYFNENHD